MLIGRGLDNPDTSKLEEGCQEMMLARIRTRCTTVRTYIIGKLIDEAKAVRRKRTSGSMSWKLQAVPALRPFLGLPYQPLVPSRFL